MTSLRTRPGLGLLVAMASTVIGCGTSSDGLRDCATERAENTGNDLAWPDCFDHPQWSRQCGDDEDRPALTQDGLVWAGSGRIPGTFGVTSLTITDATTWQDFLDTWFDAPPDLPEVDFTTHLVAIAHDSISSTCGEVSTTHGLMAAESSSAHLYLEVEDGSGACHEKCDMDMDLYAMYAIPREDGYPVVCISRRNTCDQD